MLPFTQVKVRLPPDLDLYKQLSVEKLECVARGRKAAIFVLVQDDTLIPLVRSTTKYEQGPQPFSKTHSLLAAILRKRFKLPAHTMFNNVMQEMYSAENTKMGWHTDQALDLAADSFICIFSCYSRQHELASADLRRLRVRHKASGLEDELVLFPNTAVLFSTETNGAYTHKIVGQENSASEWLGLTFRQAVRFVHCPVAGPPRLYPDDIELRLASACESQDLFRLKRSENADTGFVYPSGIEYTLSPGDLQPLRKRARRPLTVFMLFKADVLTKMSGPGQPVRSKEELHAIVADAWRSISQEELEQYKNRYLQAQKEYCDVKAKDGQ